MESVPLDDLPEDVQAALKRAAHSEHRTVAEYVLDMIRRDVHIPSQGEWFARLTDRSPVLSGDPLTALDEARTERDKDLTTANRH